MRHDQYVQRSTAQMEKILDTSATDGLSEEEAARRARQEGKRSASQKRGASVLSFFTDALHSGALFLLLASLLAAWSLSAASVIFLLVFYVIYFTLLALFRHGCDKGYARLEKRLLPELWVIRGGKRMRLSPEALVVGDLLLLSPGDVLYTHAHVVSDASMKVYCERNGVRSTFDKTAGPCFDVSEEPGNFLCPGDIVRDGEGLALVTAPAAASSYRPRETVPTLKSHGAMCKLISRISYALAFLLLLVSFVRVCFSADYNLLAEALLCATVLVTVAMTDFYELLFDLLFLYKNKRLYAGEHGLIVSLADAEELVGVDTFVLSTRSMFRSARYTARYFEGASGKRVTEKHKEKTPELALVAAAVAAIGKKCTCSMEEQAILGFCTSFTDTRTELELLTRASNGTYTLASFRGVRDGRSFSVVSADAQTLIPDLLYVCEDGKTRLIDAKTKEEMLRGARALKKIGYRLIAYAETQARNTTRSFPSSFTDMRLLGFFALRKGTDGEAARTLRSLEEEGKKAFFLHDGDDAGWLKKEVKPFEAVPILDGNRETFRDELAFFAQDPDTPFCIGIHITPLQRAHIVHVLEASGRRVAVAGRDFNDHRMMCAGTVSIAPLKEDAEHTPPLILEKATVRAREHITSQVNCVKSAPDMLGSFGVLTAALCASLLARVTVAFFGFLLGRVFLSAEYCAVFGTVLDFLAFACFVRAAGEKEYLGKETIERENEKNLSLLIGTLFGAICIGVIATVMTTLPHFFSFAVEAFVFFSFLIMLNVGMWRFSSARHTPALGLLPLMSAILVVVLFLIGQVSEGRVGFLFTPEIFFWALLPITLLLAVGMTLEGYFKIKNKKFNKGVLQ